MIATWLIWLSALLGTALYLGFLVYALYKTAPLFWYWMNRHSIRAIILALLMAVLLGLVGSALGLRDLFWEPAGRTPFVAGLCLSVLLSVMLAGSYFDEPETRDLDRLVRWSLFRHGRAHWRWPAEFDPVVQSSGIPASEGGGRDDSPAPPESARPESASLFLIAMSLSLILLLAGPLGPAGVPLRTAAGRPVEWPLTAGLVAGLALSSAFLWLAKGWRLGPTVGAVASRLRMGSTVGALTSRLRMGSTVGAVASRLRITPPLPPRALVVLVVALVVLADLLSRFAPGRETWYFSLAVRIDQILYLAALAYSLYKSAPLYLRWMNRQPIYAIILVLLLAILFEFVGRDFGLGDLFWHQDARTQFLAGLSLALLFSVMFALSYLNDGQRHSLGRLLGWSLFEHGPAYPRWPAAGDPVAGRAEGPHSARLFLTAMALPLILLLLGPFSLAMFQLEPAVDRLVNGWLALGFVLGFILANLAVGVAGLMKNLPAVAAFATWLRLHPQFRHWGIVGFLTIPVVFTGLLARSDLVWNQITAAMAICFLFSVLAIFSFATYRRELVKVAGGLVLLIWIAFTNSDAYKMRYPGLERYYAADQQVRPSPPIGSHDQDSSPVDDDELTQKLRRKRRQIEDRKAVTTTRPRDKEAWNALGRANFEAGELQDQAPISAAAPAQRRPDLGNEDYYQAAIDAFAQSIRFQPNEAFAYASRGTSRAKQLRRIVASPATPPSLTAARFIAGSIVALAAPSDIGNFQESPWSVDRIATVEKAIRDDYIMANQLDPDDHNVCLACFTYFDNIGDTESLISIKMDDVRSDRSVLPLFLKRIQTRHKKGDLDGAIADIETVLHIETALRAEPRQSWLNYLLGNLLVRRALMSAQTEPEHDLTRALECFAHFKDWNFRVRTDEPSILVQARVLRASVRADLGDLSGAVLDIDEAAKYAPEQVASNAHYYRGRLFIQKGQLDAALREWNQPYRAYGASEVASAGPDNKIEVDAYLNLAQELAVKGDNGGAVDYLDRAAKLGGQEVGTLALRGAVLARMGDLKGALRDLDAAIKQSDWDGNGSVLFQARRNRARVLLKMGTSAIDLNVYNDDVRSDSRFPRPGPENRHLLRSRDLLDAGRVVEAIMEVGQAIETVEDDAQRAESYVHRGDLRTITGAWGPALRDYVMARLTVPQSPSPYARRGLMRAYAGDLDGALDDLNTAYQNEPWHPGVLGHFGAVRALRGEFTEALALLNRAIERDNDNPETHLWRGLVAINSEAGQSLEDFREIRRLDVSFLSPISTRGIARAWKGDLDAAIQDLRKSTQEDPRDGRAMRYLGAVLARKGEWDLALAELDKAICLDCRDAHACALRGAVLALKGQRDGALRAVDAAVELDGQNARVHALRGAVLAQQGQCAEAIRELTQAIDLDGREPWTYAMRGAILGAGGNASAAQADYRQARKYLILGERLGDLNQDPDIGPGAPVLPLVAGPPIESEPEKAQQSHARVVGGVERDQTAPPPSFSGGPAGRSGSTLPNDQEKIVNILKRMLIPKERDQFHCNYFRRRSEEGLELSAGVVVAGRERPSQKIDLPERELEPGSLDDQEVLERWAGRITHLHPLSHRPEPAAAAPASDVATRQQNPKLVVVATSGGGITAAYWTALCLTELERRHPDFPHHVRIITGASGGMVGAAAYVCELTDPKGDRTGAWLSAPPPGPAGDSSQAAARRRELLARLQRDALTPVIRELILSDLPSMFAPGVQKNDRGQVLEAFWEKNFRRDHPGGEDAAVLSTPDHVAEDQGLGMEFLSLATGEKEGWRPSMIISPMIIEGTQQLLISNLDLEGMAGGLEFFKQFRRARLKLSTALRMNAAFPLVTPAVNLPTIPPRRVVDAGYKENYGVELAAEWLDKHRDWLSKNTSGVILIQLRAYPLDGAVPTDEESDDADTLPSGDDGSPWSAFRTKLGKAMQWATSPFEGLLSANRGTMITINNQKVERLRARFNDSKAKAGAQGEGPDQEPKSVIFRTFVLTSTAAAPLSWYLTKRDAELLEQALKSPNNEKRLGQIERLLKE